MNNPSTPSRIYGEKVLLDDPWRSLRAFTDARIGLGRTGISVPSNHWLDFQLAHAQAKDAVNEGLAIDELIQQVTASKTLASLSPVQVVDSRAATRAEYLQNPNSGRCLSDSSKNRLQASADCEHNHYDVAIVIADGLSAQAVNTHAVPFIEQLLMTLQGEGQNKLRCSPLVLARQGRVAIGDEISLAINSQAVLMLIGERPGLSSPDSMGAYFTWNPKVGVSDAERNCVSNIRCAGLSYTEAAQKVNYLFMESRRLQCSGIELKEASDNTEPGRMNNSDCFLL